MLKYLPLAQELSTWIFCLMFLFLSSQKKISIFACFLKCNLTTNIFILHGGLAMKQKLSPKELIDKESYSVEYHQLNKTVFKQ